MRRETFVAQRRRAQDAAITMLHPIVEAALTKKETDSGWYLPIIAATADVFDATLAQDGGDPDRAAVAWRRAAGELRTSLTRTDQVGSATADRITVLATAYAISTATIEAAHQDGTAHELEWVTMHDDAVRTTHAEADGQRQKPGHKFQIGLSELRFPGDPTAPIKEWINCRCTLAATSVHHFAALTVDTDSRPTQGATMVDETGLIPWHGILAPEGVWSGDRRMFAENSLTHRDLPLPLTYQDKSAGGHDAASTVASIEWIERRGSNVHAGGHFMATEEADKAVGLLAHFGKYGVSVDADDTEMDLDETNPDNPGLVFSAARIAGSCMVGIPAFQEANIMLGEDPDHILDVAVAAAMIEEMEAFIAEVTELRDVSPKERKGLADKGHAMPDGSYPIANCGDLKNAIQAIGRAKDPAATKRHIKKRASALNCPDVSIPEGWAEEAEEFGRGPGWVTNPEDTKRIHDYWTVPGEPGYIKIGWGVPGDFNRCRVEVGQEIAENSPEKTRFLNQICAQWHHDALGFWPGHAPTEQVASLTEEGVEQGPAISLVASTFTEAPATWFTDPEFAKGTPITYDEEDGRIHISGHIAYWGQCHTGFSNVCVVAPASANDYAYFLTGEVMTTDGPVRCGNLVTGSGHAPKNMRAAEAMAFYDNTGTAVADVNCGEDEFGIWINGWVRPWATEEQVYTLRASSLSGDWRRVWLSGQNKSMELIAAVGVNSPGLPVPRARIAASNGEQITLVASAPVIEAEATDTDVNLDEFAEKIAEAMAARVSRRAELDTLAAELEIDELDDELEI